MKVLVTGASGQLGAAIVHEFRPHADVVAWNRDDLDIADDVRVRSRVTAEAPSVIVNCAAYNLVDAAEDDPVTALNVNAFGVRALARAAAAAGSVLVHYGSDFVFDGRADRPYEESDRPNPQSVYAMSKLLGEWFAADVPRHYMLRVESLFGDAPGGPPAKGSVATILNTLLAGGRPKVFEDRVLSATFVPDAARATRYLVEHQVVPGLYHCVNSGHCTWVEFARELERQLGLEDRIVPITVADIKVRAARPQYCALSNEKLAAAGFPMPAWRDAVTRYLESHLTHRTR